jgi:RNA polymerase sigma-70 factor (ECF subfamily)
MRSLELNAAPEAVRAPTRRDRYVDSGDFAALLKALRPEVLRFTYWLARDRSLAEDIVQETMLRAWRSREALQDGEAARAWLMTIARREHARLYERKRLELVSLDGELNEGHFAPSLAVECPSTRHELEELRDAILKLPIAYRQPLVMQVLGGFTTKEIARELGLSLSAVLTRLFRARSALRKLCDATPAISPQATCGGSPRQAAGCADTRRQSQEPHQAQIIPDSLARSG